ncbi:hypothetical protein GGTG_05831 [Gaeumannomyces tritici R3-111a-1]|uniref:Uncharacterized protein n=1 Tax=Gaeumannomyces tritici (strain R3-111a-1) TaxID=644352 RepID=J3NX23_GAET3|nr:hypothetical protein GGTG_05831 [Gaeumannomyces tritici R3-111a-1]EJT75905.1 hypothetical protein GGTG_05831 [Gaeumannomyces tritici R3-111a-1]
MAVLARLAHIALAPRDVGQGAMNEFGTAMPSGRQPPRRRPFSESGAAEDKPSGHYYTPPSPAKPRVPSCTGTVISITARNEKKKHTTQNRLDRGGLIARPRTEPTRP